MSPSKELRDASNEAEVKARDYGVELSMRLDLFKAKQAAQKHIRRSGKKLSPEEQRLVDKMIQDGTRAGLALPEKEREELTKLKKEMSAACLEFSVRLAFYMPSRTKGTKPYMVEKLQRRKGRVPRVTKHLVADGCCRVLSRSLRKNSRAFLRMSFQDIQKRPRMARNSLKLHSRHQIFSPSYVLIPTPIPVQPIWIKT